MAASRGSGGVSSEPPAHSAPSSSAKRWLPVSPGRAKAKTRSCLRSGGAYDVTIGPVVNAWGFGPRGLEVAGVDPEEIRRETPRKIGRLMELSDRTFGAFVDVTIRVQETVKLTPGQAAIHEFDATDFDDPVALRRGQAGRFRVEDDLSHVESIRFPGGVGTRVRSMI